jgi:SAM-dependent methyltransferase
MYSGYYDLLYADKNYKDETDYVRRLLAGAAPNPVQTLLDLGCGTGIHAGLIAGEGLDVLGVDASAEMLAVAKSRTNNSLDGEARLSFCLGDARDFRCERYFDAVSALFHVLSYQTCEADLQGMMETASVHLRPGGLFLFDFWYGPAVLWQKPAVRVKTFANDALQITRIAEPVVDDARSIVDVNYTVFVNDRTSGSIHSMRESHRMRYLFLTDIDRLLEAHAMERLRTEEWMTGRTPSTDSWSVCVVARKNSA